MVKHMKAAFCSSSRRWMVSALSLLAIIALSATATIQAAENAVADSNDEEVAAPALKAKPMLCRLISSQAIRYQTGSGPWVSQSAGEYPALVPLSIRNGNGPCRIELGPNAFIECAGGTSLDLARNDEGRLIASVKQGSILYNFPEEYDWAIRTEGDETVTAAPVKAEASEQTPTSPEAARPPMQYVGRLRFDPESQVTVQMTNIRGAVTCEGPDMPTQTIPTRHSLRVARTATLGAAALGDGVGAASTEATATAPPTRWNVQPAEDVDIAESLGGGGGKSDKNKYSKHPGWVWCPRHGKYCPEKHPEVPPGGIDPPGNGPK